ncbi:transglutaminase [Fictibacillus macauensis ZFHKF-1]|uniref:Transglutaminase n=1 Tax=Fictibacillus macauensis ZFHKF-1 TaxID=1196324 RepID=I8AFM6_9BACL|nr:transglutaminase domain-containing protein [Fictibacillus macauensis]EIT84437.1 transglutaminase [Fictibacillus macauensis ZFHKF-1]
MQAVKQEQHLSLYALLLYGLGYCLLAEWIYPLGEVANTDRGPFVFFLLVLFCTSVVLVSRVKRLSVQALAVLYVVYNLADDGAFFQFQWLQTFSVQAWQGIPKLLQGEYGEGTMAIQSLLLVLVLWLFSLLLRFWLFRSKRIGLFLFLTIVYEALLYTFMEYTAEAAIIRTLLFGLLLASVLHLSRLTEREGFLLLQKRVPHRWMVILLCFLLVTMSLSMAIPKAEPLWEEAFLWIQSLKKGDGASANASVRGGKSGYGTNDEKLGGPFRFDYNEVFIAKTSERHNWRVETKDFYTGKGWTENSEDSSEQLLDSKQLSQQKELQLYMTDVKTKKQTATVEMKRDYSFLISPGELTALPKFKDLAYYLTSTGKITTRNKKNDEQVKLQNYTVSYNVPTFEKKVLQDSDRIYPTAIKEQYLQLPSSLPKRVKALARKIVKGKNTPYDEVKAVEQYFAKNGFVYTATDVKTPGEKEDFVDRFLFATKKGYCDYYSTSMIVLLRSIGIPARWVKGFTPGDFEITSSGERRYSVKNANAHSWPEVYFQGIGWVPFEPTVSYTNPVTIQEQEKETTTKEAAVAPIKKTTPNNDKEDASSPSSSSSEEDDSISYSVSLALFLVLCFGIISYSYRRKWLKRLVIWHYRRNKERIQLATAYERLLWLADYYGYKRDPALTLREYATYLDQVLDTNDMGLLTAHYEKMLYKKEKNTLIWTSFQRELWENLINKMRA